MVPSPRFLHDWKNGPLTYVNGGGVDCAATSPCSVPLPRILLVALAPLPWVIYVADDGLESGIALRDARHPTA